MSQRDLIAELRGSRIAAPAELRERVRSIAAAGAPAPRPPLHVAPRARRRAAGRRGDRRRARRHAARQQPERGSGDVGPRRPRCAPRRHRRRAADRAVADRRQRRDARSQPPAAHGRVPAVRRHLALRVPTPDGVSDGVKRALGSRRRSAAIRPPCTRRRRRRPRRADLTLKIPRDHVQAAITRLSRARDDHERAGRRRRTSRPAERDRPHDRPAAGAARDAARAAEQTDEVKAKIAALTARIQRLQRGEAATIRAAHFATIALHLQTPREGRRPAQHGHGPLHGLGVALRWIGIGAVYVLALGAAARRARRARLVDGARRAPPARERAARAVVTLARSPEVGEHAEGRARRPAARRTRGSSSRGPRCRDS